MKIRERGIERSGDDELNSQPIMTRIHLDPSESIVSGTIEHYAWLEN